MTQKRNWETPSISRLGIDDTMAGSGISSETYLGVLVCQAGSIFSEATGICGPGGGGSPTS